VGLTETNSHGISKIYAIRYFTVCFEKSRRIP
jgi:hypothetical protein